MANGGMEGLERVSSSFKNQCDTGMDAEDRQVAAKYNVWEEMGDCVVSESVGGRSCPSWASDSASQPRVVTGKR